MKGRKTKGHMGKKVVESDDGLYFEGTQHTEQKTIRKSDW